MPEVKCFTFSASYKIKAAKVTDKIETDFLPAIVVDDQPLSAFLKFTCTNPDIGESESEEMLEGYFIDLLGCVKTDLKTEGDYLLINSTFLLQFELSDPVSLNDNEIAYVQEDGIYSYAVTPSFSPADCPKLSESVEIEFEPHLIIEEAVKEEILF